LLNSWEWTFGHTLSFTHQMDEYLGLGFFDVQFKVNDGLIEAIAIYTDCLYPHLTEQLKLELTGKAYLGSSIAQAFSTLTPDSSLEAGLSELKNWLIANIEA
jgi:lipoate-protein ligase A